MCRICSETLQSGAPDGNLILMTLDLMRIIVAKLPIGPHLGAGVLDIVCSVVERTIAMPPSTTETGGGAVGMNPSGLSSPPSRALLAGNSSLRFPQYSRSSIAAIGVLNELMGMQI